MSLRTAIPARTAPTERVEAPRPSTSGVVGTRWQRRDWVRRRMLAVVDGAALLGALMVASAVANPGHLVGRLVLGALSLPAWVLLLKSYGLYERDLRRISHSTL